MIEIVETTIYYSPYPPEHITEKKLFLDPDKNNTLFLYPFGQTLRINKTRESFGARYRYNAEWRTLTTRGKGWTIDSVDFLTEDPRIKKIVYLYHSNVQTTPPSHQKPEEKVKQRSARLRRL